MAAVDRDEFSVGKLPTAEESVHEELIIHLLEVQVWGDSVTRNEPKQQYKERICTDEMTQNNEQ